MPTVIAVKRPCGWYINSRKIDSQGAWGEVPVVPPGVRVTDDSPNRKRRMRRLLVVAGLAAAVGLPTLASELEAQSADEPFKFALFSPLQARGPDSAIQVLRLSLIYGENVSVKGLDIGLVMRNTGGESKGLQWGLVGFVEGDFVGLQNAAVNVVEGTITGMQWGLYNQAAAGEVFQLGLVNMTDDVSGFQLGLVNFAEKPRICTASRLGSSTSSRARPRSRSYRS